MYMALGMGCFAMFRQKRGLTIITAVTLFTKISMYAGDLKIDSSIMAILCRL